MNRMFAKTGSGQTYIGLRENENVFCRPIRRTQQRWRACSTASGRSRTPLASQLQTVCSLTSSAQWRGRRASGSRWTTQDQSHRHHHRATTLVRLHGNQNNCCVDDSKSTRFAETGSGQRYNRKIVFPLPLLNVRALCVIENAGKWRTKAGRNGCHGRQNSLGGALLSSLACGRGALRQPAAMRLLYLEREGSRPKARQGGRCVFLQR